MTNEINISVVGNCQVAGIGNALRILASSATVTVNQVNLLFTPGEKEKRSCILASILTSDLVFSQPLRAIYSELSEPVLQSELGSKIVVIPNIFFEGFHPNMRYAAAPDSRLSGSWVAITVSRS